MSCFKRAGLYKFLVWGYGILVRHFYDPKWFFRIWNEIWGLVPYYECVIFLIFCFVEVFSRISVGTDEKREYPNCEKSTTPFDTIFLHNVRASEKIKLRSKKRNFFHFCWLLLERMWKGKPTITSWGICSAAQFRRRQSSGNRKSRRKKL